jgi:hypothetical protein
VTGTPRPAYVSVVTDAQDVIRGGTVVLVATGGVPSDHVLAQRGPLRALCPVSSVTVFCCGNSQMRHPGRRSSLTGPSTNSTLLGKWTVTPLETLLLRGPTAQGARLRLRFSLHPVLHPPDVPDVEDVAARRHERLERRGRELLAEAVDVAAKLLRITHRRQ